jgi:RNA polymerase sigma factor (sigma-70 family)
MATDAELLAAWRAGDRRAGDELVSRHWASIAGFFRAKVAGDHAADLIAQTFLACCEGKDRIEGDNVKAYLFAIARNRLADHLRRILERPTVDWSMTSLADLATGPFSQLWRTQRDALLKEALRRIPLDEQIAIELFHFEHLTTHQLSLVLAIPENTVRSRLSRARTKLRDVLRELSGSDECPELPDGVQPTND